MKLGALNVERAGLRNPVVRMCPGPNITNATSHSGPLTANFSDRSHRNDARAVASQPMAHACWRMDTRACGLGSSSKVRHLGIPTDLPILGCNRCPN